MIRVVSVRGLAKADQWSVCYVGRRVFVFAEVWPASLWGNPFKPRYELAERRVAIAGCLSEFREYADAKPPAWLAELWKACGHGAKPLGCWCIDATHGDGQPVVCHAQILAGMLVERFTLSTGTGDDHAGRAS